MVRILNIRSVYYSHRFGFVHKKKKKSNKSAIADPSTARRQFAAGACLNPTCWKITFFLPPVLPRTPVNRRILLRTYIYI